MTAYLIRRAATAIVVLFGVSIFIFFLLHMIYPSPAIDVLGPKANKVSIEEWNKQHGFDDPLIVQYLRYVDQLLHGNLGYSYKLNQSVAALFQERWRRSAYLSGISAVRGADRDPARHLPGGPAEHHRGQCGHDLAFVTYAMPDFFLYLIAIQLLALTFPIFGFEASQSTSMLTSCWTGAT